MWYIIVPLVLLSIGALLNVAERYTKPPKHYHGRI